EAEAGTAAARHGGSETARFLAQAREDGADRRTDRDRRRLEIVAAAADERGEPGGVARWLRRSERLGEGALARLEDRAGRAGHARIDQHQTGRRQGRQRLETVADAAHPRGFSGEADRNIGAERQGKLRARRA